jgi:hypothetical protein
MVKVDGVVVDLFEGLQQAFTELRHMEDIVDITACQT